MDAIGELQQKWPVALRERHTVQFDRRSFIALLHGFHVCVMLVHKHRFVVHQAVDRHEVRVFVVHAGGDVARVRGLDQRLERLAVAVVSVV